MCIAVRLPWFGLPSQALIERRTCSRTVPKFDPPLTIERVAILFLKEVL